MAPHTSHESVNYLFVRRSQKRYVITFIFNKTRTNHLTASASFGDDATTWRMSTLDSAAQHASSCSVPSDCPASLCAETPRCEGGQCRYTAKRCTSGNGVCSISYCLQTTLCTSVNVSMAIAVKVGGNFPPQCALPPVPIILVIFYHVKRIF